MAQTIFRKAALERLSSPEQLDQLLRVTSPRGWIALIGLCSLLVVAVLWGIFGSVSTTVEGQGILIRPAGVKSVVSPQAGSVSNLLVQVGDVIYKDQEVMRLTATDPAGGEPFVISTHSGRVLEILVRQGSAVDRGTPLIMLEPVDNRLTALLYLPIGEAQRVEPGMKVDISPASIKWSEYGYLIGEVTAAGKFASSKQGMMRHLENEELVQAITAAGPSAQVTVDLRPDSSTASGYQWTSSKGPPLRMHHGTPCRARITVRVQRPISLVIPTMRELLGF